MIYILDQDQDFAVTFMNSSILQLAACLQSHEQMVDEALNNSEEDVVLENRIPLEVIKNFEEELSELDPSALERGSFWATEIERCKEGLEFFKGQKKFRFELYGLVTDFYEALRLKKVTLYADGQVVRILADFLAHCADGIEQWEPGSWDHAHLRDYWADWFSIYPDFEVRLSQKQDNKSD